MSNNRKSKTQHLWIWDDSDIDTFQILLVPYLQNYIKKGGSIDYGLPMYFASLNDKDLNLICDSINLNLNNYLSSGELESCPEPRAFQIDQLINNHRWIQDKKVRDAIYEPALKEIQTLLQRKICGIAKDILDRIKELEDTFSLSAAEISVLKYLYLMHTNRNYASLLESIYENKATEFKKHLALVCNLDNVVIDKAFSESSRLVQCGILYGSENYRPTRDMTLSPSDEIIAFLNGMGNESFMNQLCEKIDVARALDMDDYDFSDLSKQICAKVLSADKGCNLLFYGAPGLGKTSFCSSLAKKLDYNLYKLKSFKGSEIVSRLRMAIQCIAKKRDILLIDEADNYLNTFLSFFGSVSSVEKGVMNQILESHQKSIIWITNRIDAIEPSTRRRFDYSLEFKGLNEPQREKMWAKTMEEHGENKAPFNLDTVTKYFKEHQYSPANIKSILNGSSLFLSTDVSPEIPVKVAKEIAKQQIEFCKIPRVDSELKPTSLYRVDYVNTDISLDSLVKSCQSYLEHREDANYPIHNVSMLFYGAPGCGKTEFAKHLASSLKTGLMLKKASDILDKYVGGTEENIARVFKDAEDENKILFIDEADSLLQDRSGAQRSWEVSQVNELLVQMEQFKGIVLFSTNFEKCLDKASLRRFHFKVQFGPIRPEHVEGVYLEYFKKYLIENVPSHLSEQLAKCRDVTFGDFKVVLYRLALGQIEANQRSILDGLKQEIASRRPASRCGF